MAEILILESDTFLCKNIKKYNLVSRILTCIQKVCKKPEIHAKIWPYIKNSNLHSKKQKFTQKYGPIPKILTCIQKVCKKTDFHAKIQPYIKTSNLHSKGMQKTEIHAKIWPYIKNSNLHSKGMQKNKNSRKQSNLLMDVVMIYFYSKRFRFAPSFNNSCTYHSCQQDY